MADEVKESAVVAEQEPIEEVLPAPDGPSPEMDDLYGPDAAEPGVEEAPVEPAVKDAPEFKGVVSDLAEHRQALRAAQEANRLLEERLAAIEARQAAPDEAPAADPEPDDDELLTVGQLRKMREADRKRDDEAAQSRAIAEMGQRLVVMQEEFTKTLPADESAGGLDLQSVIEQGSANLSEGHKLAIRQSKNPVREAYELCILANPALTEKRTALRNARLLASLKGKRQDSGSTEPRRRGPSSRVAQAVAGGKAIEQLLTRPLAELRRELEEEER
jgi:hypothetical protein